MSSSEIFSDDILKHFFFLVDNYKFKKEKEYQYVREVHNDFIGEELIIKIYYDGHFFLDVKKKSTSRIIKSMDSNNLKELAEKLKRNSFLFKPGKELSLFMRIKKWLIFH